jgi:hypothetical protein
LSWPPESGHPGDTRTLLQMSLRHLGGPHSRAMTMSENRYFGVSFSSLLPMGVSSAMLAPPVSVRT